ncbi:L-serine ammonia-lyase, iron-sulfur-dependent, subunit alpha [Halanaerobiaceae bacterium Z-7014]|uniref:L-serine dehydratase n=1 Tax=Halonatronomonas betaini TaxID=2778430 RepID=A0A931F7Q5_9FIRM|nr:L-serine ammonia-lyase, iron-sulfur-dependent, subunit alpha [Halonatronomonas betaini]MBF8435733.1 L-serine ammonia-lyase, iron-sulfur-dependent, subunit alpha [Halonatronomonas betaini]
MELVYRSVKELFQLAEEFDGDLVEAIIKVESFTTDKTETEIKAKMQENLEVMRKAIEDGKAEDIKSPSGLVGGEASKLEGFQSSWNTGIHQQAAVNAIAVGGVNACMGRVVASPTAGASGIVPAVIFAIAEENNISDDKLVESLFVAAALGRVVAKKATLAGAAGGCQAECGVGAGMAAGAAVYLGNGSKEMIGHGFSLALKNLLGLVCDPVAGLVEVPCVKRNGFAASHAITAATMALAGIESKIPADDVILAMKDIGDQLPLSLKETSEGGLAITEAGLEIKRNLDI